MKKLIFILFILLCVYEFLEAQTTPYRIRMPNPTYAAQLRGVAGTRTDGLTVTGSYSSYYRMHVFSVAVSGRYQLYADPAGGTAWALVSTWGGTYGKTIPGDDIADFYEFLNASSQVLSTGLGDTCVATAKIKNDAIDSTKLASLTVFTQHLINDAVDSTKLASSSVFTQHIIDAAIPLSKTQYTQIDTSGVPFATTDSCIHRFTAYTDPVAEIVPKSDHGVYLIRVATDSVVVGMPYYGNSGNVSYTVFIKEK